MSFLDELTQAVDDIVKAPWNKTEGRVIPKSEDIALGNHGISLDCTMLYADLADSTRLAMHNREIAAEVYKAFLTGCSKIIRLRGGQIRSFDGDRVMGVFLGAAKNTSAAKSALNINYFFLKILKPRFERVYAVFREGAFDLAHCVGIDTSTVTAARAGIRNNNDVVWIGRSPNVAAKLSTLRQSPYHSYITDTVYNGMLDDAKFGSDGRNMWESRTWTQLPEGAQSIYRSSWQWQPG